MFLGVEFRTLAIFLLGAIFIGVLMTITTLIANKRPWSPATMTCGQLAAWWTASAAIVATALLGGYVFLFQSEARWLAIPCGIPVVLFLIDGVPEILRYWRWPKERSEWQLRCAYGFAEEGLVHAAGAAAGTALENRIRTLATSLPGGLECGGKRFAAMPD